MIYKSGEYWVIVDYEIRELETKVENMIEFKDLPTAKSCRRIDFEEIKIHPGFVSGTYILIVTGIKPCLNMKVDLMPLVYIKQPEYWEIEVVGCLPGGICLESLAPYTISSKQAFSTFHRKGVRSFDTPYLDHK